MNYYKQGDAANADKIKAAFESKGCEKSNTRDYSNKHWFFFTYKGKVICTDDEVYIDLVKGNPDYKELELPKHHYDISNFKPFDKVLVRQNDSCTWGVSFFGRFDEMFMCCTNVWFEQCIPFNEETKHLLGTTDMCDEQYVNW